MKYDYLIVGSGLFGAVFAHEAKKAVKKCIVLERRPHIGGNAYTERVEGITVHRYGAHIFHTDDKKIWEYVTGFGEFTPFLHRPLARFRGETYNLPFNMHTFSQIWGVTTSDEAKKKIEEERALYGTANAHNLEQRAINLVGKTVYEKLVKGYTEKQWGRPCSELPPSIIERLPVRFTYDNNYFSDRFQGVPADGYTPIIEKMLEGTEVILNCDFLKSGREYAAVSRKIVYTGAIDEYFDYRFGALEYRSLRFEDEVLDAPDFQGNAVVNYTGAEVPFTRIIEHKHFGNQAAAKTVITREYPQAFGEGREPFYPVNDGKNEALYKKYLALAAADKKVIFGGRLGLYKYMDMDDTVAAALKLCRREFSI